MKKLLLFSHSGFSDENANGITMKNILSAWAPEEKAEFYCDVQPPDFSAAHQYFRVTDVQVIKSLLGKKSQHIFEWSEDASWTQERNSPKKVKEPKRIPLWLKKYKYNFALRWIREYLKILSPWGQKTFRHWLKKVDPDVIFYMVGESVFLDQMVLTAVRQTGKPLVLYNGEGYRVIELRSRKGLERAFYRKAEKSYAKLDKIASLVIYNSEMLKSCYQAMYAHPAGAMVAYNSAACDYTPYKSQDRMNITYFGNLGVGRSEVLVQTAAVLKRIEPSLVLNIYGNASKEQEDLFEACGNIRCHGFVDARRLHGIIEDSDILLHVETFNRELIPKLRYAFSTKIAQCLCAGRCFVSFAPQEMASSQYLQTIDGVFLVHDEEQLETVLRNLIADPHLRKICAEKVYQTGLKNHQLHTTAGKLREEVERLLC